MIQGVLTEDRHSFQNCSSLCTLQIKLNLGSFYLNGVSVLHKFVTVHLGFFAQGDRIQFIKYNIYSHIYYNKVEKFHSIQMVILLDPWEQKQQKYCQLIKTLQTPLALWCLCFLVLVEELQLHQLHGDIYLPKC